MKSHRNLWPQVVSWDNLLLAYRRCRRRKRYRRGASEFDFAWESNLLALQRELADGSYAPGPYRHFWIREPKRRKISAAPFRDRIVHHAIVNVLEPMYEPRFIFDSYACRRGKGTHRAIHRAQQYLRRYAYVLQTDIVRFFPNVDHQILLELLGSRLRDERLMALIRKIIASGEGVLASEASRTLFPGDDLWALLRPCGLPIGNLTSQFFANVFLDPIDHFIKEELRIGGYVRYADDLLLFADDKAELWAAHRRVAERLAQRRLRLHPDKTQIRPCQLGITYLGLRLLRETRRLTRECIGRFQRRRRGWQRLFATGQMPFPLVRQSLGAWLAHTRTANAKAITKQLLRKLKLRRKSASRWPETQRPGFPE